MSPVAARASTAVVVAAMPLARARAASPPSAAAIRSSRMAWVGLPIRV